MRVDKMSKKSLLYGLGLFLIICISLGILNVKAHPPTGMTLSYNSSIQQLSVTITHSVGSDPSHYIQTVEIDVNGTPALTTPYNSQPDPVSFTYQYTIPADTGATIQVTAICSISGSITRSIIVGSDSTVTPEISGYYGLLIIIGLSLITILISIKKKIKKRMK
jgi:hypothetical protein